MALGEEVLALAAGGASGSAVPAALEGPYALNRKLQNATRLFEGQVHGSESVGVAGDGTLVMLDKWGYVRRAAPASGGAGPAYALLDETPGYVGPGRPLGFHVDGGAVVICDSLKGLTRYDMGSRTLEVLANEVVGPDGRSEED